MSTRSAISTSSTRASPGLDRPGTRRSERVAGELGDLARHLDPGRPAADDDEGEQGAAPLRVGLELGGLESAEQPRPQLVSALSSDFTSGATRPPLLVAEVGVPPSRRQTTSVS